jgi:uncharacterized protein
MPPILERLWDGPPMKILVERLGDTPTQFAFDADTSWWHRCTARAADLPEELAEPLRVHLWAHRMAEDLYLEGRLEASLELECGRCLARYGHVLHEPFRLVLEPAGSRQPTDPEGGQALARDGVCVGEDIEAGWYRGPEIDLGALLCELVLLALPVQPLCREDCAGLCSRCGADRNRGACGCPEIETHSPFAVLESLRTGRTKGDG